LYVPASWTAGQVVDFLTEYAHDLNNPMGRRFLAELQTNGIFSGRIGFEEYNSLLKQGLAATAEQAEGLIRQAISLAPGGDLALATWDAQNDGIISAALTFAKNKSQDLALGASLGVMIGVVAKRLNALNKKAYAKTADGEYWVAKHKDFTPRGPDIRSHHGVMSAWMEKHFPGYKAGEAPTVHMPTGQHYNTTGVFNEWRAEIKRRTGAFDWGKVTQADMRALSEKMFDAGNVPQPVRDMYWQDFDRMLQAFAVGRAK
ncbi:MAG: hypothetical protein ACK6A8_06510, partial [Planctomycetota bacterium]